jgi:8-amino-7-oxononanoate synthase
MVEINKHMAIGFLMKKLVEEGITDLESISDTLHSLKELQNQEGLFPYDRYTEFGSDSKSRIITEFSNEKKDCILWCLNHYLAMNRNPNVIRKAQEAIGKYGTGCGTSGMSGGMNSLHKEVEHSIARLLGKERAILFSTGYTSNLGAITALVGKNDLILFDHECHASIIDGCQLSGKKWLAFHHNDVENLDAKLTRLASKYQNIFVAVESIYSMSGDACPIQEIVALKQKHKFYLYVDEAHSFGLYGPKGAGYCVEKGVADQVDFIMASLSKGAGSVGGIIATKEKYCTLIQCYGRPYIFQTCLSPAAAAATLAALEEIAEHPEYIDELRAKTIYFRKKLSDLGFDLANSNSSVVPVYIRNLEVIFPFSRDLYQNGIFSVAVAFPAVKITEGRIRFTVNRSHTQDQLDQTINTLEILGKKYGLIV